MNSNCMIQVWPGERKLLPLDEQRGSYRLRCLQGQGYLRVMSSAARQRVEPGDDVRINAEEIATLTAMQNMLVKINFIKKQSVK